MAKKKSTKLLTADSSSFNIICKNCKHYWYGASSKGSRFTTWWCRLKKLRFSHDPNELQHNYPKECLEHEEVIDLLNGG